VKAVVLAVLFLGGLVLGICGGGEDDAEPDLAADAVQLAIVAAGLGWPAPPVIGQLYDCELTTRFGPVAARCRWDAFPSDPEGTWRVVFHETWACRQFAANDPNYPPCSEATGFHEWVFDVDYLQGAAEVIDETGQFPPDYAR
jgi:hypothetical protein